MGSCAGCGNPQRKLRSQQLRRTDKSSPNKQRKNLQEKKTAQNIPQIQENKKNKQPDINISSKSNKGIHESTLSSQPWKHKIIGRTISKYIKPVTLKQQESNNKSNTNTASKQNIMSLFALPINQKKTIGEESLENQIKELNRNPHEVRYHGSEFSSDIFMYHAEKSEKNHDISDPVKDEPQNQEQKPKRYYTMESPVQKMQISLFSDRLDIYDDSQRNASPYYDPPLHSQNNGLTLKKSMRENAQEKLNLIKDIFDKETETPNYVRGLKIQNGEDIRYDNIGPQEQIPDIVTENMCINLTRYLDVLKGEVQ